MVKKKSESSAHAKPHAKNVKHTADSKIDFNDMPELSGSELKKAKRVGRPKSKNPNQMIAFRIEPKLLNKLTI